jgi:dTDP-4-dehydrorhamnose reductase
MFGHLLLSGVLEHMLMWFLEHPCPPDILGIDHNTASERYLDDRLEHYPEHVRDGNGQQDYADVEAVRVLPAGPAGLKSLQVQAGNATGDPSWSRKLTSVVRGKSNCAGSARCGTSPSRHGSRGPISKP